MGDVAVARWDGCGGDAARERCGSGGWTGGSRILGRGEGRRQTAWQAAAAALASKVGGAIFRYSFAGVIQLVECQLPKLDVAGSSPVARSASFHFQPALVSLPAGPSSTLRFK